MIKKINLDSIGEFFEGFPEKTMPAVLLELITASDERKSLTSGKLETKVVELFDLKNRISSETADKINFNEYNVPVPVVREKGSSQCHVYEPDTGEYLGKITIEENYLR